MTLGQFYDTADFFLRKNRGDGFVSDDEFNNAVDFAQIGFLNTMVDNEIQNQSTATALNPFREKFDFTPQDFTGEVLTLPANFQRATLLQVRNFSNGRAKGSLNGAKLYKTDEWDDAINSQVVPATAFAPAAMEVGTTEIEFHPGRGYDGVLRYIRMPRKPVIAFNFSTGAPVYDPVNSVELEWADRYHPAILLKTLSIFGVHLSDAQLTSYAEQKLANP